MVADEADGTDEDVVGALGVEVSHVVEDVWFEPGLVGCAAAGLIDEVVFGDACANGYQTRSFGELLDVLRAVGHPVGDGVGGEDQSCIGGFPLLFFDPIDQWIDEAGVVEVDAELVDLHRFGASGGLGGVDVFTVLPAAGITTEGRGDEGEDAGDAVGLHLREGVVEEGVPVAIAEVDGEVWALLGQELGERVDHSEVLLVDRAFAAEVVVVLGYDFETLAWNAAASGYVFKERHDVGGGVGATEADKKDCV